MKKHCSCITILYTVIFFVSCCHIPLIHSAETLGDATSPLWNNSKKATSHNEDATKHDYSDLSPVARRRIAVFADNSYGSDFQIKSALTTAGKVWCIQPGRPFESGSRILLKQCIDNSNNQSWRADEYGQIHSTSDDSLCMMKKNKRLLLGPCAQDDGDKNTLFIINVFENTIVWKKNGSLTFTTVSEEAKNGLAVMLNTRDYAKVGQKWNEAIERISYFQIKSALTTGSKSWCVRPNWPFGIGVIISLRQCTDSNTQRWRSDKVGQIHYKEDNSLCIARKSSRLELNACVEDDGSNKRTAFLFNAVDDTIALKRNGFLIFTTVREEAENGLNVKLNTRNYAKVGQKWSITYDHEKESPTTYPTNMPTPKLQEFSPSSSPSITSSSQFTIALMNMGAVTEFDEAFQRAKVRWERVIVGDLPDVNKRSNPSFDWFQGTWPGNPVNVNVDDVLIGYDFIDNIGGNVLGFAGPSYITYNGIYPRSVAGIMKFDYGAFSRRSREDVELIILHEMGHVLGIGTFFSMRCGLNCPVYSCDHAAVEYDELNLGDSLQLQRNVCGHWAESSFDHYSKSELMTPYFESHKYQPISRVTVGALKDLGYGVNMNAADPWIEPSALRRRDDMSGLDILKPTETFFLNETMFRRPDMITITPD